MKAFFLTALLAAVVSTNMYARQIAPSLHDSSLVNYLRSNYYPTTPRNYNTARDSMYTYLDVDASDSLTCVYTGLRAKRDGTRTPSNNGLSFNTEHTWPQSFYNEEEPMRGDIHHLFPSWSSPNQSRGNHPFAEIDDNNTTSWWFWQNGGSISTVPSSNIDEYSEYYNDTFEPREDHKGNVARAIFYFWTMYQNNTHIINDESDNQAFFDGMKETLYAWHKADPVDAVESARNEGIESIQGNSNPYIEDSSLVRRAFFYTGSENSETDSTQSIYISEVFEANGGQVKYIELFNYSDSSIVLENEDWELWRYSNDNTSPATIDLTGTIESRHFFVVGDDNANNGVQTVFGDGMVNLENSAINHNGNDKYLLVRYASSSPDTIDSFGKDNIGNTSYFAQDQIAYRVFSALPNNGSFGQTVTSNSGDTVASGNWVVFDVSNNNSNGTLLGTPGYSKGVESPNKTEALISGTSGWRLISIPSATPTLNQIADDIPIQGVTNTLDSNIFLYDESGDYYKPSSMSENIGEGKGILIYFFDNNLNGSNELPVLLDVTDNDSETDVSINLNTSTLESGSYFTLVGNPFQSNYDLSELIINGNIQANIQVLKNGLYSPVAVSSTTVLPWQGFWVEAPSVNAATQITFPLSGKTNGDASVTAFNKEKPKVNTLAIKLTSEITEDFGCNIEFRSRSTLGFDAFDATKLNPAREEYAILGCEGTDRVQSIISMPDELDTIVNIPLVLINTTVEDQFKLDWKIDLPEGKQVTLIDNELNKEIEITGDDVYEFYFAQQSDLALSPSQQSIAVPVNKRKESKNRFEIQILPSSTTDIESVTMIKEYKLFQNYPNPFNPETIIRFNLRESGKTTLQIFDALGRLISQPIDGTLNGGEHEVKFNAINLPTGVYYYRLKSNDFTQTQKMMLIK